MKVAIIGVGLVGTACAKALLLRGSCHEIVLIDLPEPKIAKRTQGIANDLSHGAVLCPHTRIEVGGYDSISDASVVIITAGINEKEGGATDPNNPWGRLLLLPRNTDVYRVVVPRIVRAGCRAPIVVVTDPPDPLADVAIEEVRKLGASNAVLSAGTFLDSVRFRLQISKRFDCTPKSVDAMVIGEHGKSQVYVWSSARVGGRLVTDLVADRKIDFESFRKEVEAAVRYANIQIIEGTGASQHGIGIVTTRIVEAMLRDEQLVEPVGLVYEVERYKLTLSLPARIGAKGATALPLPSLSEAERGALRDSAAHIAKAVKITAEGGNFDGAVP